MQFRHVVEVHAVHADDEGQGDKEGGNDGEELHRLVHLIADAGQVGVVHAAEDIAGGFNHFHDLDGMVIKIA